MVFHETFSLDEETPHHQSSVRKFQQGLKLIMNWSWRDSYFSHMLYQSWTPNHVFPDSRCPGTVRLKTWRPQTFVPDSQCLHDNDDDGDDGLWITAIQTSAPTKVVSKSWFALTDEPVLDLPSVLRPVFLPQLWFLRLHQKEVFFNYFFSPPVTTKPNLNLSVSHRRRQQQL